MKKILAETFLWKEKFSPKKFDKKNVHQKKIVEKNFRKKNFSGVEIFFYNLKKSSVNFRKKTIEKKFLKKYCRKFFEEKVGIFFCNSVNYRKKFLK